jgi:hypothetical protein
MAVKKTEHVAPQVDTVVDLRVQEYLLYKVTALGQTPMFTLADDRGRTIMTSEGVPPQMNYERKWPSSPTDDPVPRNSEHAIVGLMGLITKYRYTVELHKKDDSLKETVIDNEYERIAPLDDADQFRQSLGVGIKK